MSQSVYDFCVDSMLFHQTFDVFLALFWRCQGPTFPRGHAPSVRSGVQLERDFPARLIRRAGQDDQKFSAGNAAPPFAS